MSLEGRTRTDQSRIDLTLDLAERCECSKVVTANEQRPLLVVILNAQDVEKRKTWAQLADPSVYGLCCVLYVSVQHLKCN